MNTVMAEISAADRARFKERIHKSWSDPVTIEAWRRWHPQFAHWTQPLNRAIIEAAQIRPGQRVLDLASGSGEPSLAIAELLAGSGEVVATDLAVEMLGAPAAIAAERGLRNISFRQADAEALPFGDAEFDAVTCRLGIMFCPDPVRALSEARRVLRPGGRGTYIAWGPAVDQAWFTATVGVLVKYAQLPAPEPGAPTPFSFAEPGSLAHALRQAGFDDVHEEWLSVDMEWPGAPESYSEFFLAGAAAFRHLLDSLLPEQRREAVEEVLTTLGGYYDGRVVRTPSLAVVAYGIR